MLATDEEQTGANKSGGIRPTNPASRGLGKAEVALLAVAVVAFLYHSDHVLRADYSGWPFLSGVTPFTASLLIYPVLLMVFLLRSRQWIRVAAIAAVLGALQVAQMFYETPDDQYRTWAHGESSALHALGNPNLLRISSPVLGVASIALSLLLTLTVAATLLLLAAELQRLRRLGRAAAVSMIALVLIADCSYAWAVMSTNSSQWARMIAWQESDVLDYQRFPARPVAKHAPTFHFDQAPGRNRIPVATVPVRQGGRVVERDLEEFLRSTQTTAFLVLKGNSLIYEGYFNGYRHDSIVASFSVAKPFVSALVGIAITEGHISSIDDPVTKYLPELAARDVRFNSITLRHLVTMSSGLRDEDPYYSLDLRTVALKDSEIGEPPGERFHYNNINTILLGLVLERATGGPVSAYLEEKLWGPLGMEADGAWNLDSDRSRFEQMQTGLSGRAVDFAKFGALYLNEGAWQGRQLVPHGWVTESTRVDVQTDPALHFQYNWWTRPASGTPNDFWAQGNHGQFIYVAPGQDVVLVRFGIEYGYDGWPELLAELARRL